MRRVALRRGSSARTSPSPDTPFGMRARLKPLGQRGTVRDRDANAVVAAVERAGDLVPGAGRLLCLMALVSSSLRVSAIGIDSTSGRVHRSARRAFDAAADRPAERALHRARDRLDHAHHRQRPVLADLQAVDLRDRLHLADDLVDRRRDLGLALRDLLQQPGHALQVVLDPVVHFLDQHLALRDRRLEARFLRRALLAHVGGDEQELVGRRAGAGRQRQVARVPDARLAVDDAIRYSRVVTSLDASACSMSRRRCAATSRGKSCSGVMPTRSSGASHDGARRDLVDLHDPQRPGVEQRDRQRRRLDHPAQRGLRLRHRRLPPGAGARCRASA